MLPLLNLPRIPRDEVVKQIGLTELFHFSMLSKRCAAAVDCAKIKVEEVLWKTTKTRNLISLLSENGSEQYFHISLNPEQSPGQGASSNLQFTVESSNYSKPIVYTSKSTKFLLEHLSAHILKIFKVDKLNWDARGSHRIPIFWHRLNLQFDYVTCLELWDIPPICSDSVKFLLDNLKTDSLHLDYKLDAEFKHSEPLKYNTLYIENAHWFTLDNLLNMECEILRLEDSNITSSDLNVFSEKWKQGCYPKLTFFKLCNSKLELNITIEETDDEGRPILTDVNGNRGTFETIRKYGIRFKVNFQDD